MHQKKLADGVRFLALRDSRFKTARLSVGLFLPLREQTAAAYAILPEMLTRATAFSPDMVAMHRRLSRLYGAALSSGVQRLGDHQVLTLGITYLHNDFALNGEDIAANSTALLLEMLFSPHLSPDGLVDAVDLEQEKRCLIERIAASLNDKRAYAREQADTLLANGEPYGVPLNGTMDMAAALTRESVTAALKTVLETAVFQFVYVGADDGEKVAAQIKDAFKGKPRAPYAGETQTAFSPLAVPREGSTTMAVNQAKLCMCFRLQACEPDTQAVMTGRLLAALFGGTPSSLLFRNVREKMSLCYYCSAVFERVKGVLTVNSGVDATNVQRVKTEILRQLDVLRDGAFSEEDLENARRYLIHQLRDHENVQGGMVSWYMGQALSRAALSVEQAIDCIKKVDKAQIIALANTVNLQSVYAVLPEEETV